MRERAHKPCIVLRVKSYEPGIQCSGEESLSLIFYFSLLIDLNNPHSFAKTTFIPFSVFIFKKLNKNPHKKFGHRLHLPNPVFLSILLFGWASLCICSKWNYLPLWLFFYKLPLKAWPSNLGRDWHNFEIGNLFHFLSQIWTCGPWTKINVTLLLQYPFRY